MIQVKIRSGFTMVETAIALVLGLALLMGAWALIASMNQQQQYTREHTGLTGRSIEIQGMFREDLQLAGSGLISSPNWSGINVGVSGTETNASDTLSIFWAEEAPLRNSVFDCPSLAAPCMLLVGNASSLSKGDLVVTGSPTTGAQLFQIDTVGTPFQASCGADCTTELLQCTDLQLSDIIAPQVDSSTLYFPDGTTTTQASTCTQSYYPDGTRCEERSSNHTVGSQWTPSCVSASSPTGWYTEASATNVTNLFGYPSIATFTKRSGSSGTPQVRTQKVSFIRYWIDRSTPTPRLMRQEELQSDGTFAPSIPVAQNVHNFRVQTTHSGEGTLVRGVGVNASDLSFNNTNPNFTRISTSPATGTQEAFSFARSYKTIAGVRITFSVDTTEEILDGEKKDVTLSTLVATPALLVGGAVYPF